MAPSSSPFSLTAHLQSLHPQTHHSATHSLFLSHAASGRLPKSLISTWLANDRLYMRGYIRLTGFLLQILQLPSYSPPSKSPDSIEVRLLDWLVEALVNIRREERFFVSTAEKYGIDINLAREGEEVGEERKREGLKKFERLFDSLVDQGNMKSFLPWLEGAVVFWATEKVYFEAWSWAKRQVGEGDGERDLDGGAMRTEFIPNWTNDEFIGFVDRLEGIVDDGVREAVGEDEGLMRAVIGRAEGRWKELLEAEEAFWPEI